MHIIEYRNKKTGTIYCYVGETKWDKNVKGYETPRVSIGKVKVGSPMLIPNSRLMSLLETQRENPLNLSAQDELIIETVQSKYRISQVSQPAKQSQAATKSKTAWAVFAGPDIVFGGITQRYRLDSIVEEAFGYDDAKEIISLAWYLASEGDALCNSDVWLSQYETPHGKKISSQDISRLLDRMDEDGIMTFYREWLKVLQCKEDKALYDLTSLSWYGKGINMAGWGYNRDKDNLPQVNYAFLCSRNTGMPLFAWVLDGSISDVRTLINTLQFLKKLGYMPDCLMMDRAFGSEENIVFMLMGKYTFLQALKINSNWIREIIDEGTETRMRPDSILKCEKRTYYTSSVFCRWVIINKTNKRGETVTVSHVHQCRESKRELYVAKNGETIVSQYPCTVHVLFCHDLVGSQKERFMEKLNVEYARLLADKNAAPASELEKYFVINKAKGAKKRSVDFNMDAIAKHHNNYTGYVCFITNDKTISTPKDAIEEYSTRDYIEKDFDEMKNELDMRRIRVHTDERMKARLLIQFIAEIYIREIRISLRNSEDCKRMTKKQIFSHIKSIYKIKFKSKYDDVCPDLSKSQRSILEALEIADSR